MYAPRFLLLGLLACAACDAPVAANTQAAPAPVEVAVITVAPTAVTLRRELPGRVAARRVAEVRARTSGIVEKRLFEEGSDVQEGQPLYRIEAAPYEADLAAARASLKRAESLLPSLRDTARRDQELLQRGAVSRETAELSAAQLRAVEADIAAGRAAVKAARINLEYTTLNAPIAGRIGRSLVTEGDYVQQAAATLMATIQQLDPVYVDVTQSTAELQRLRRELESERLRAPDASTPVSLILEDGSRYGETGTLQFTDVTVDERTSSVTLRAAFPNPRNVLLPGMFVRAVIEQGEDPQALLVPQRAVARDQRGQAAVLVVTGGKVERRPIEVDRTIGASWRVTSGLAAGEQVIVDGLQRARPGAPVNAVPAPPEPPAP